MTVGNRAMRPSTIPFLQNNERKRADDRGAMEKARKGVCAPDEGRRMWAYGGFSLITDVHNRSGLARRMSTKSMLKKKFLNAEKDAFNAKKEAFDVIYTTHAQIDKHHPVDPGTSYTVVPRGVADLYP